MAQKFGSISVWYWPYNTENETQILINKGVIVEVEKNFKNLMTFLRNTNRMGFRWTKHKRNIDTDASKQSTFYGPETF